MGMDISGILAFGIKLPEDFPVGEDDTIWDVIDDLFYVYNEETKSFESPYPGVKEVYIGNCDEPEIIVASVIHSVDWTAEPINLRDLEARYPIGLEKFCKDFNLEFDPKWYLGCYVSY